MYSLEQRKRAVELYIKYGLRATAAIRELGYPSRAQPVSWHRERQENGGRLTDRGLEQYTPEQKRAAVGHCLTHGRCNAFTGRELGYPKCTAKLAEWIDEYAPGERRATQPRVFDASEKAAAARALASRASSAQEVADLVGCTRSAPYKWKRELLREEPPMSGDRPSKPARTRGGRLRPRRTSPLSRPGRPSSRPSSRSSSSGATSWRVPSRSWEKGRAPTRQTSSRTGRRPC